MTDSQLVERQDKGTIVHLVLNNPTKMNAISNTMFQELRGHIERLEKDDETSCVILRGAGKCFSSGNDLTEIQSGKLPPDPHWHSETLRMFELLPQPTIAAVHGYCFTGALEVALSADFIVAADTASFADTHAKWALTPVWGLTQRLPRRVGTATAKRLSFTSQIITAEEALRIGLCEQVFPMDEFESRLDQLAETISTNSAFSNRAVKCKLEQTECDSLDEGLRREVVENEGVGPDFQSRIERFGRG